MAVIPSAKIGAQDFRRRFGLKSPLSHSGKRAGGHGILKPGVLLTVPGFELVFPLFCTPRLRDAGNRVARWLGQAGVRSTPASQEIWRSYASLADAGTRRAFFRNLRDVVDFGGQAVSALGRLHRAAQLPTLIVWGARDPFIPVSHVVAAHKAIPGSRLEILDGVRHYPHCEAPERFIDVLLDFIASTEPARPPPHSPAPGTATRPGVDEASPAD